MTCNIPRIGVPQIFIDDYPLIPIAGDFNFRTEKIEVQILDHDIKEFIQTKVGKYVPGTYMLHLQAALACINGKHKVEIIMPTGSDGEQEKILWETATIVCEMIPPEAWTRTAATEITLTIKK